MEQTGSGSAVFAMPGMPDTDLTMEIKTHTTLFNGLSSYSRSLEALQESIEALSVHISEQHISAELSTILVDIRTAFNNVSNKLETLTEGTQSLGETIGKLGALTSEIEKIIEVVRNIANQTKLLALNANIQAVHAGDAGRGFTVVAGEIKALADQTDKSAANIAELIKNAGSMMDQTTAQTRETLANFEILSQENRNSASSVERLVTLSNKVDHSIQNSAVRGFIETVKVDHLVWKMEVYKVMMGVSRKKAIDFSSHRVCRLGKWYYEGAGRRGFAHYPEFQALDAPHQAVHEGGLQAMAAKEANDLVALDKSLDIMERASLEVVRVLDALALRINASN